MVGQKSCLISLSGVGVWGVEERGKRLEIVMVELMSRTQTIKREFAGS